MTESSDKGRGRGGPYDKELWIKALSELGGNGDTTTIHEKVEEIGQREGLDKIPTRRTTENWLKRLTDEGKVSKRKIGNSTEWSLSEHDIDSDVLNAIREGDMLTTKKIADEIGKDEHEIRDVLYRLEEEDRVGSEEVRGKSIWFIPE